MSVQLSIDGTDVTSLVRVRSGLAFSRGKDQLRRYAPASAGQLDTALDNVDGSLNPGSIPYSPGDEVQVSLSSTGGGGALLLEDGTPLLLEDGTELLLESSMVKTLWTGRFIKRRHQPDNNNRSVSVLALGDFSLLRRKRISTPVFQNISVGAALNIILDLAGWPLDKRIIATGLTILPWWWLDRENAFDAAERLRITEGPSAVWVEDRDGNAVFQDRDHRATQPRSISSQITFTDSDIVAVDYDENEDSTIEQCTMQVEERAAQALAPVWTGQDFTIGPSEVYTIRFKAGDPFINAVTPDPTPSNTIWKFEGDQRLLSGTFKIRWNGQLTSAIPWNASGTTIAMALEALSTIGSGNAVGSGSSLATGPVFVELVGPFAGVNITDLPTVEESTLNPVAIPGGIDVTETFPGGSPFYERQQLKPSGVLIAGTFTIGIVWSTGSGTAGPFNYNATATEIADGIVDDIFQLSNTTAHGGPIHTTPVELNLVDLTENIDLVEITGSGLMMNTPSATVTVSQSQPGGVADYVVTNGTITSVTLSQDSGVSAVTEWTAGAGGATVTVPRARAQSVSVVRTHEARYPEGEDIPEGNIISPNVFPTLSLVDAESQCEAYVNYYLTPRPTIRFTKIVDADSSAVEALAELEISDRATINITRLGVNADFFYDHMHVFTDDTIFAATLGFEQV